MLTKVEIFTNRGPGEIWYHIDLDLEGQTCQQVENDVEDYIGENLWAKVGTPVLDRVVFLLRDAMGESLDVD